MFWGQPSDLSFLPSAPFPLLAPCFLPGWCRVVSYASKTLAVVVMESLAEKGSLYVFIYTSLGSVS